MGGGIRDDLGWIAIGVPAVLVLAFLLSVSVQATAACTLVLLVIGLHQYDRVWGLYAMFALWFLAPGLRRVLGLFTGYVENDPLSLAPFIATAAIAALELVQVHMPSRIRLIMLMAALGFAIGLPVGMLTGPRAAVYAVTAYIAGLSAVILGFNERGRLLKSSTLRTVLVYGLPAIALYAIAQRAFTLPAWDQYWLDNSDFNSIGASRTDEVRVFATLNSPGALAPLLCLSLLCYLSIRPKHPSLAVLGAGVLTIAISLTLVRSAWISLIIAALAHVIASRGASARLVFGAAAVAAAVTLALAPVSTTARDVLNRFETIGSLSLDRSADDRQATFSETLPKAVQAPIGHGLGSAGEPSKLTGNTALRAPDNGYLSLIYQVGPIAFLMVIFAIGVMLRAAWRGARDPAPGQDLRLILFTLFVFTLAQLFAGDQLYGSNAVIFWFIGGHVLAYEFFCRRRRSWHPGVAASRTA